MTDYQSFKYGAVTYPLPALDSGVGGLGASLLRDADPAIFYLLEFYESLINTHIHPRMMAEVVAGNIGQIEAAVAEILPMSPEPFILENQLKFPLLAAYRKHTKFRRIGQTKHSVDDIEVSYVLPPLQAGEAERLMPVLAAIVRLFDNRTEIGADPSYTPSSPTGAPGDSFWVRAGLASATVTAASYGGYAPTEGLYFPAVTISVEVMERSDYALDGFEEFSGSTVRVDVQDSGTGTTVPGVAEFEIVEDTIVSEAGVEITTEASDGLLPES